MTLNRDPKTRELSFECDGQGCNAEVVPATDDFEEARHELRSERWTTRQEGGEWKHYCPDCAVAQGPRKRWYDDTGED